MFKFPLTYPNSDRSVISDLVGRLLMFIQQKQVRVAPQVARARRNEKVQVTRGVGQTIGPGSVTGGQNPTAKNLRALCLRGTTDYWVNGLGWRAVFRPHPVG